MKTLSIILVVLFTALNGTGQTKFDYSARVLFNSKEETLERYRGRPLLLELFGESCVVCFTKMPYMDSLHREYKDQMSIVLLGDNRKMLPRTVERFRKRFNLTFDVVFDSALHRRFNPPYAPHYYWVDKEGNTIADTGPDEVTRENLDAFVKGNYDFLLNKTAKTLHWGKGLLPLNSLKGLYHRSYFGAEIDSFRHSRPQTLSITEKKPLFEVVNGSLDDLFKFAFFGKAAWDRSDERFGVFWQNIECEDSAVAKELQTKVCYSLAFGGYRPPPFLQATLRADLLRVFGLTGRLEQRVRPYWALIRKDTSSNFLRSTHTVTRRVSSFAGLTYEKVGLHDILQYVEYRAKVNIPVLDETDVYWPVDLTIDAIMTDFEDVRRALSAKGLYFEKKMRPVQVLVVTKAE
jgi:thiol-disulfide isomerase/thioredoxin